jgi:hypothetical protein
LMDEHPTKARLASASAAITTIWWARTAIGETLKPLVFKKDGFRA